MTLLHQTDAIWGTWRARQAPETQSPDGFARMLALCLDLGITWIDHADIYDNGAVEQLHGEASTQLSAEQRRSLNLVSKCGVRFPCEEQPGVRVAHYRSDPRFIEAQVESSLTRLKAERLDLLLLHRPDYLMNAAETAAALDGLVAAGKIAAYGVSNFSIHQLDRLQGKAAQPLAANQVELSPLMSDALENGVLDQALTRSMPLMAWSPLGGGRLFNEDDPAGTRLRAALAAIGARHDITDLASVALAWVRRCGPGVIPILGTMSAERLRKQVEGLRAISMETQDWYEILEAGRGQRVP